MKRRDFILSTAAALPAAPALAAPHGVTDRDRMARVIEQLETAQGWEVASVVAAKAFAAWQIRKALGFDLLNPEAAQGHIDYQRQAFEQYRRTVWFERDNADGKRPEIATWERALA